MGYKPYEGLSTVSQQASAEHVMNERCNRTLFHSNEAAILFNLNSPIKSSRWSQ